MNSFHVVNFEGLWRFHCKQFLNVHSISHAEDSIGREKRNWLRDCQDAEMIRKGRNRCCDS